MLTWYLLLLETDFILNSYSFIPGNISWSSPTLDRDSTVTSYPNEIELWPRHLEKLRFLEISHVLLLVEQHLPYHFVGISSIYNQSCKKPQWSKLLKNVFSMNFVDRTAISETKRGFCEVIKENKNYKNTCKNNVTKSE